MIWCAGGTRASIKPIMGIRLCGLEKQTCSQRPPWRHACCLLRSRSLSLSYILFYIYWSSFGLLPHLCTTSEYILDQLASFNLICMILMLCIYECAVVEVLENLAFLANASNLVLYLHNYMHLSPSKSANNVTNFMGTAFLLALLGGFFSDAFFTSYHIYLISAVIQFLVSYPSL